MHTICMHLINLIYCHQHVKHYCQNLIHTGQFMKLDLVALIFIEFSSHYCDKHNRSVTCLD